MNELLDSITVYDTSMFLLKLTFVLAFVWLIQTQLRVSAAWRCRIWRSVPIIIGCLLAMGFLPPQIEFAIQGSPINQDKSNPASESAALIPLGSALNFDSKAPNSTLSHSSILKVSTPQNDLSNDISAIVDLAALEQQESETILQETIWAKLPSVPQSLALAWLFGATMFAIRFIASSIRSALTISRSTFETTDLGTRAATIASTLQLRSVPDVVSCSSIGSPCVMLIPSRRILVPTEMTVDDGHWDLDGVLAHELAHLKRHDWQWNLLFHAIEIIFWFHPLVWKLRQSHLNECENACDDLAASATGSRATYRQTLARVALSMLDGRTVIGIPMARKSEIMDRLRRLEQPVTFASRKPIAIALTLLPLVSLTVGTFGFTLESNIQQQEKTEAEAKQETDTGDPNTFLVKLSGLSPGQLSKATVTARYYIGEEWKTVEVKPSDKGIAKHKLGDQPLSHVLIVCRAPDCVPFAIEAHNRHAKIDLSNLIDAELTKGYPIRGSVKDSSGNAVPGARVKLTMHSQNSQSGAYPFDMAELVTDLNGQWKFPNAPWELKANRVYASVEHDDYMRAFGSQPSYPLEDAVFEATLQRGTTVSGKVVDATGKPIAGANVTLGPATALGKPTTDTNASGDFSLKKCRQGKNYIVTVADGYAPNLVEVDINDGTRLAQKIVLTKGKTLTATLVDQNSNPVANANVGVQSWRKDHSLGFKTKTDASGKFIWKGAPSDPVWFTFKAEGHRLIVHHELFAETPDQKVTLYTQQKVKLKVVDAKTGDTIPMVYTQRALKFSDEIPPSWDARWFEFENGEIDFRFMRQVPECWLRIAADGYESVVKKFKLGDPDAEMTISLKRLNGEKEMAWESVRVGIETGVVPMNIAAVAHQLHDNNATLRLVESRKWVLTIRDKWTIQSAMLGVPNISQTADRETLKSSIKDIAIAGDLPNLTLKLEGLMINAELLEAVGQLTHLKVLDLDDCPLDEAEIRAWSALAKCGNLRELYFDGHWQKFPAAAVDAMTRLPKLEKLVFDGCGAYHMDSKTFAGRLSKMKSLRHLELTNDAGFDNQIGEEIKQLENLKHIGVVGAKIDDQFIKQILQLELSGLNLHRTGVTDAGLRLAADGFRDLKTLDICRTKITADGVKDISSKFPKLRRLDTEEYDRETLVGFKRLHPTCIVKPMGYISGGVVSRPQIELTEDEKK
ncbi:MAG: M56 family metallopeptidase [Mariniblastus sp.]